MNNTHEGDCDDIDSDGDDDEDDVDDDIESSVIMITVGYLDNPILFTNLRLRILLTYTRTAVYMSTYCTFVF
jgi:hypothetical protein